MKICSKFGVKKFERSDGGGGGVSPLPFVEVGSLATWHVYVVFLTKSSNLTCMCCFSDKVQQLDMYVLSFWQSPATWHVCVVFLTTLVDNFCVFHCMHYNNAVFYIIGKDFLSTDLQLSDHYLLLAAYTLVDLWSETGEGVLTAWWEVVRNRWGCVNHMMRCSQM